jgi:pimeloyl-ACP methyl ester carboxylesterase
VLAGGLLSVLLVWWTTRDTAPVGHFTSPAAKARFVDAYEAAMRDLPAPDGVLDVRTSYGTIRVYRFNGAGSGRPPLVLLPGRASASPVWADNLPSLLALRSVYTIDLLGEPGMSVQERPIRSDDDQARWLHEVLTQLPEPELHLVGMSIGGWTAMNVVLHQPEKVASVTLLDPVFVFTGLSAAAMVRAIPASVRWFPKALRDSFASWTAGGAPVEDVPIARMIEAGMQTYALELPAPTRPSEHMLEHLDVPVLAIIAGDSVMHDAASAADVARRSLRPGDVKVYAGASHAVNGEHPDRIAQDLAVFLATTE